MEKYLLLAHTQTFLSAMVAILCLIKFKSRDKVVRLIGLVFLTSFLANLCAFLFVYLRHLRAFVNIPHVIYLLISLILFSRVYYVRLHKKGIVWFILVSGLFFSFSLINIFFIQKASPNSYANILHSGILIIYSLLYFYVLIRDLPSLYVHHLPMFWFNSALLIFHAGAFFLFSFTSYLVNVLKNDMITYWSFHNMLSIIMHFIFLIGVYYDLKFLGTKNGSQPFNPPNTLEHRS